jgi:hypothetical protein
MSLYKGVENHTKDTDKMRALLYSFSLNLILNLWWKINSVGCIHFLYKTSPNDKNMQKKKKWKATSVLSVFHYGTTQILAHHQNLWLEGGDFTVKSAARITSPLIPSPQTVACQLAGYLRQGKQTQDYIVPKRFTILLQWGRATEVYTLSEISIKGL